MTPSLPPNVPACERPVRAIRRGFTLVEMLVVIGIILLLVALLLPAVERAYREAMRTAMAADLQTISEAIENYRTTFGDYPRSTGIAYQSQYLCWALVAPGGATNTTNASGGTVYGDGADGPGFRLRGTQGMVYGPYLAVDRFPMGTQSGSNVIPLPVGTAYDDRTTVFADRYGHVILYIPAYKSVSPSTALVGKFNVGQVPPLAYYNFSDFNGPGGNFTQSVFACRVGHSAVTWGTPGNAGPPAVAAVASPNPANPGLMPIVPGEIPILAPYILWSAGPDGVFGPQIELVTGTTTGQDDDVTYPLLDPVPAGVVP